MCQPNAKTDTRRKSTLKGQECSVNYFKSTDVSGIWRADDRQAANQHTLNEVEDGNVSAEEECPRRDTDMPGRAESGVHALGYVKELQMWRKERGSKQENRCRKTPGWISLPKGKGLEASALQKSWVWIICKYIWGAWKQDPNRNSLHSFHVRPTHTIWGDLILCFQNFDLSYEIKCIILYLWCPGRAKKFFKFCNTLDLHTNNI